MVLFHKIPLPTRFSEMNGTLIDNVLCRLSNTSINNYSIIVTQLSYYLTYFICLRTMKVDTPEPIYIYIKQTTETSMNRVIHEIITASIYDKLNTLVDANPNINYDILDKTISQIVKTLYSGTPPYGHLTSKVNSPLGSLFRGPNCIPQCNLSPCNTVTSPLRSFLPNPMGLLERFHCMPLKRVKFDINISTTNQIG